MEESENPIYVFEGYRGNHVPDVQRKLKRSWHEPPNDANV